VVFPLGKLTKDQEDAMLDKALDGISKIEVTIDKVLRKKKC
jgi:hypothetical protein